MTKLCNIIEARCQLKIHTIFIGYSIVGDEKICVYSPPSHQLFGMITYKVSQYINKYFTLQINVLFLSWVSSPNNRSIVNVLCPNIFCDLSAFGLHYSQAGIAPTRDFLPEPLFFLPFPARYLFFFFLPHYFQCQNANLFIFVQVIPKWGYQSISIYLYLYYSPHVNANYKLQSSMESYQLASASSWLGFTKIYRHLNTISLLGIVIFWKNTSFVVSKARSRRPSVSVTVSVSCRISAKSSVNSLLYLIIRSMFYMHWVQSSYLYSTRSSLIFKNSSE